MNNIIEKTASNVLSFNKEEIKSHAIDYLSSKMSHLSDKQKQEFVSMCAVHGLNPFKREIHASAYGNQMQIVVGYEVYLKRAAASGLLDGYSVDFDKEDATNPIAIATVYRKGWSHPVVQKVAYKEYVQKTKEGKTNKFWAEKPRTMLEKVAISQAFRKAFPDIIDGLPYTSDEVPSN